MYSYVLVSYVNEKVPSLYRVGLTTLVPIYHTNLTVMLTCFVIYTLVHYPITRATPINRPMLG